MGVATGFAAGALGGGLVGMVAHDLGAWLPIGIGCGIAIGAAVGFAAGALGGGLVGMVAHDLAAWLPIGIGCGIAICAGNRVGAGLPEEMKAPVCRLQY